MNTLLVCSSQDKWLLHKNYHRSIKIWLQIWKTLLTWWPIKAIRLISNGVLDIIHVYIWKKCIKVFKNQKISKIYFLLAQRHWQLHHILLINIWYVRLITMWNMDTFLFIKTKFTILPWKPFFNKNFLTLVLIHPCLLSLLSIWQFIPVFDCWIIKWSRLACLPSRDIKIEIGTGSCLPPTDSSCIQNKLFWQVSWSFFTKNIKIMI